MNVCFYAPVSVYAHSLVDLLEVEWTSTRKRILHSGNQVELLLCAVWHVCDLAVSHLQFLKAQCPVYKMIIRTAVRISSSSMTVGKDWWHTLCH